MLKSFSKVLKFSFGGDAVLFRMSAGWRQTPFSSVFPGWHRLSTWPDILVYYMLREGFSIIILICLGDDHDVKSHESLGVHFVYKKHIIYWRTKENTKCQKSTEVLRAKEKQRTKLQKEEQSIGSSMLKVKTKITWWADKRSWNFFRPHYFKTTVCLHCIVTM